MFKGPIAMSGNHVPARTRQAPDAQDEQWYENNLRPVDHQAQEYEVKIRAIRVNARIRF